jgi:PAS domain S-box-containing protein
MDIESSFAPWMYTGMKRLYSRRLTPLLIIAVLLLVYSFAFPWLDQTLGVVGRAFCMTYIFVAAMYWGVYGGTIAAILTIPLNIYLSRHAGLEVLPAGQLGPVVIVIGGIIIGRLWDLNNRLRSELGEKRKAEKELKTHQERLEGLVDERTQNLKSANNRLQQEICERERIENELKESEEKFRELADFLPQTVFEVDATGNITFANRNAFETFGYTQEDLARGLNAGHMIAPEDREQAMENIKRVFHGETLRGNEYRAQRKNGSTFPVIVYSNPISRDGRPVGLRGIVVDITEYKRLESNFYQSQKMESVGRLAGGVAHDFNNILTTIIGHSELGLMKLHTDDPLHNDFQEIMRASDRAANLTRQLLAFSRRQMAEPREVNLNDVLLETNKMLSRLIGEDIELVTLPAEDLGLVKVDPGQVEQIIANLAVNARDAMPKGGKLVLETANIHLTEELVSESFAVAPGDYVKLSVRDTGAGITNEVKQHIFEPFFTTKEKGQGTGLGLATCYGIVKQNGGHIWAESEPGHGTTFIVCLPRVEETTRAELETNETGQVRLGNETILLVEDEPSVREIAAHVLRDHGYEVLEASNGEEALRVAQGLDKDGIHLLLTDVVMPEMGGRELAKRLSAERPGLRVLFLSGYPGVATIREGMQDPRLTILQKPFSPSLLARRVRETLDKRELASSIQGK